MSYIGQGLPADTFQGFVTDSFTGDGSATTFTLSKEPFSEDTLIVVINNVIQKPTTNFTVSGTTLTIVGTAVASGDVIYAIHMGGPLPVGGAAELDLNGASDKLVLDADGDTTISADTDDQIDIKIAGADDFQFTANTFTAQSGSTITTPTLGVGNTKDLGAGLHIKTADSGASVSAAADDLVIEQGSSGNGAGLTILSATDDTCNIFFGDSGDNDIGFIQYNHASDAMVFTANAQQIFTIHSSGVVFNEASNDQNFRVESNDNANMFKVDAGNNRVGVGVDPALTFEVQASIAGDNIARFWNSNANPYVMFLKMSGASPDNNVNYFLACDDSTTNRLVIRSDGDIYNHDNTYGAISDERIKQDIKDANSQWDDIKAVKVRNYKKKDDVRQYGDKAWEQIGVIAQELEDAGMDKLIKESDPTSADIASDASFGTLYEDGDNIPDGKEVGDVKEVKEKVKAVSYSILYMKAIKALQEAMAKIETLETKVKALEDA